MIVVFVFISYFFSALSFFPALRFTHWVFRVFDYLRIQLLIILSTLFLVGFFLYDNKHSEIIGSQIALAIAIIYQLFIILPYLPIYSIFTRQKIEPDSISMLSVNVLQTNQEYEKLIELVEKIQPDILLTLETNQAWENALEKIESNFKSFHKIPKENTYGMHFYTNLKVKEIKEHYFISDDRPAIEAHLIDNEGHHFIFWGIHPPPPSPTEKPTSKQKDGEMMKLAEIIIEQKKPSIVAGDFNNVCWSRSSKLFSKTSNLKDARLKNGIYGTFPVRPSFFRFPIDLLFCSSEIEVNQIKVLSDIGSDHLPIFAKFKVKSSHSDSKKEVDTESKEEAEEMIEEGEKSVKEEE